MAANTDFVVQATALPPATIAALARESGARAIVPFGAGTPTAYRCPDRAPDARLLELAQQAACDAAYVPHPDSLDYSLLHGYLNGGGKLYLEGDVAWNSQDPFWSKFGANAPLNMFTNIEAVKCYQDGEAWIWDYNPQSNPNAQVLLPALPAAETIFSTHGAASADASIGILHAVPEHSTIASSFALAALQNGEWELKAMLGLILDRFGVLEYVNTQVDEPQIPMARTSLRGYPNPFRGQTSLRLELPAKARVDLNIYNLRGQKVRSLCLLYTSDAADIYSV